MARDHEKYDYLWLPIAKASPLYACLTNDVQASGASMPAIIRMRLAEQYGLTSGTAPAPAVPVEQTRQAEPDMSQADRNATLAASVWGE